MKYLYEIWVDKENFYIILHVYLYIEMLNIKLKMRELVNRIIKALR